MTSRLPQKSALRRAPAAVAARRYRYRTAIVVGPWRASRRDALRDAVRNGFAAWGGPPWTQVKWRFPGEIEEAAEDEAS